MKAKSRFLGIDDAPFRFSDETVPIVGVVVQAPSYIEGILTTLAEVDGHDATERIATMVRRSRYRAGRAAILIDGTPGGGFKVIAIGCDRAARGRPVRRGAPKEPSPCAIVSSAHRGRRRWRPRSHTNATTRPHNRGFGTHRPAPRYATSPVPSAHVRFVTITSSRVPSRRVSFPTRLPPNSFAPTPVLRASWIPC